MKEALGFRRYRIARAVRPKNRADPAKVRAVVPTSPSWQDTASTATFAETGICAAFGTLDPCNHCDHDRICAHAMPVHGRGLN